MKRKLYECSYCHNTWTIEEGFNIETGQCYGCQKWDDEKPLREKEQREREEFRKQHPNGVNFPYVAGDPFW